eukprot:m.176741 g.176741  ORF g.176741 m.176741 type:complete len:135 (+) comp17951_c1_seq2:372-776(+)
MTMDDGGRPALPPLADMDVAIAACSAACTRAVHCSSICSMSSWYALTSSSTSLLLFSALCSASCKALCSRTISCLCLRSCSLSGSAIVPDGSFKKHRKKSCYTITTIYRSVRDSHRQQAVEKLRAVVMFKILAA